MMSVGTYVKGHFLKKLTKEQGINDSISPITHKQLGCLNILYNTNYTTNKTTLDRWTEVLSQALIYLNNQ